MENPNEDKALVRYSCKDMGLKCPFVVKGKSKEEVTRLALEHVRACHADEFNLTNTPEEIGQMERALSRSTHIVTD